MSPEPTSARQRWLPSRKTLVASAGATVLLAAAMSAVTAPAYAQGQDATARLTHVIASQTVLGNEAPSALGLVAGNDRGRGHGWGHGGGWGHDHGWGHGGGSWGHGHGSWGHGHGGGWGHGPGRWHRR